MWLLCDVTRGTKIQLRYLAMAECPNSSDFSCGLRLPLTQKKTLLTMNKELLTARISSRISMSLRMDNPMADSDPADDDPEDDLLGNTNCQVTPIHYCMTLKMFKSHINRLACQRK